MVHNQRSRDCDCSACPYGVRPVRKLPMKAFLIALLTVLSFGVDATEQKISTIRHMIGEMHVGPPVNIMSGVTVTTTMLPSTKELIASNAHVLADWRKPPSGC